MVENNREAAQFTISRRKAIGGFAVGTAAAWAAPSILSLDAAGAASIVPLSPIALAGGIGSYFTADALANWRFSSDSGNNWNTPAAAPSFSPVLLGGQGTAGVAMSATGAYSFTANGGNNWAASTSPPGFIATAISQSGAVVAGPSGAWAYTTDGGDNWLTPNVPPTITAQLLTGTGNTALCDGQPGHVFTYGR